MRAKRKFYLMCMFIVLALNLPAQYTHFSQFYSSPLLIGPCFAGLTFSNRVLFNYRDALPDAPSDYNTFSVSYDQYINQLNAGAGCYVLRDNAPTGEVSLAEIGAAFTYDYAVDRFLHVRVGGLLKHVEKHDNINSAEGTTDAALSFLVFNEIIWFGATVDHLLKPNESLTGDYIETPLEISAYTGYKYWFERNSRKRNYKSASITAIGLAVYQEQINQCEAGVLFQKSGIMLGSRYRIMRIPAYVPATEKMVSSVILSGGYTVDFLSINYSYDININKPDEFAGGKHEISCIYVFSLNNPIQRREQVPCPSY